MISESASAFFTSFCNLQKGMDHSPGLLSSQQVPVIGWNMESPHTAPAVPRARIILPKVVTNQEVNTK